MARSSFRHARYPPSGTTLLTARSKTRCHANEKLLRQSRFLIAWGRRVLNPAWTISGSSEEDVRGTVRERLASGDLFPVPREVWAGHGSGHVCVVCGRPISSAEVENEIAGPTTVRAHVACYSIWQQESDALEPSRQSRAPDYLPALCQIVRDRFAAGTLFVLADDKSWTGRGISDICAVCSKPIFAAEVSQELIGARRAHAHLMCYRAWRVESVAFGESDGHSQTIGDQARRSS
jgi:hypothetical protein